MKRIEKENIIFNRCNSDDNYSKKVKNTIKEDITIANIFGGGLKGALELTSDDNIEYLLNL